MSSYESHRMTGGGKEFGLACGHGYVVADLDAKDGKANGRESIIAVLGFDPHEDWKGVPHVTTPSGGRHYYFRALANLRVMNGLLPGFDLLGLGQFAYCAPRHDYTWVRGGQLPDLPDSLLALVDATASGRGNENLDRSDFPQKHPIRETFNNHVDLEELLADHGYRRTKGRGAIHRFVSPTSTSGNAGLCYWPDIGLVYSHHGNDLISPAIGYDAFALYIELEHGISIAELREKGDRWEEALSIGRSCLRDRGVEVTEALTVEDCLERFYYIARGDRVADLERPPSRCTLRLPEFRNAMANVRIRSERGSVSVAKIWLEHPKRLDADDTFYEPTEARIVSDERGLKFVNEFEWPRHQVVDERDKIVPLLAHLEYLIPDDSEREWFTDWLAQLVQFPERRGVVPLHVSTLHGTGRGWLVRLLNELLGHWNCRTTKMRDLVESQFNDCMDNSIFCSIPEVREASKRYEIDDQIRDALTDPYFEINRKYGEKATKPVYTSFFFMSNHWDALRIGPEDRRIQVISGPQSLQPSSYFETLYGRLRDRDFIHQTWSFLLARDISRFQGMRSSATEAKRRLVAATTSSTEAGFRILVENLPGVFATRQQLLLAIEEGGELDPEAQVSKEQLTKLLQLHAKGPFKLWWRGQTVRCWQLAELDREFSVERMKQELELFERSIPRSEPSF